MSVSRTTDCRFLATVMSSSSPASCPRASLTCLTWSRSTNSTATSRPSRRDLASACSSRSSSSRRLGSPVSAVVQGEGDQLVLGPRRAVMSSIDAHREGGAVLLVPPGVHEHPHHGAVAADQPPLRARPGLAAADHPQPYVLGRLNLVGVDEAGERGADQVLARVAEQAAQGVVHLQEEALVGQQGHPDRERAEDLGEARLLRVRPGLPEDPHDDRATLDGHLLGLGGEGLPGHRAERLPAGHPGLDHPVPVAVQPLAVAGVDGVQQLGVGGGRLAHPEQAGDGGRPRHRVRLRVPRPEAAHTLSIGPVTVRFNRPYGTLLRSPVQGSQDHRPCR